MDIRKIYQYALQREYEGKRFFVENAERVHHASAIGAFKALAGEEQKHIEFVQAQLDALQEGKKSNTAVGAEMEEAGFFSQRFSSELLDHTTLEAMVPDLPILRMAYLIERDFTEFYSNAARQADGDARQALEILAGWEHRHEMLFKEFHDKAFEEYARMPWGG